MEISEARRADSQISVRDITSQGAANPRWHRVFFALVCLVVLFMALRPVFKHLNFEGDHYVYLASHFARGDITVDSLPDGLQDYVNWQGHKYLPLGPLPGVLLIPFLPFLQPGRDADITWVGHIFTLINVFLFWRVLGQAGVLGERRNWAVLLFFGGTSYLSIAVVGTSWFFAHIVVTTCLLLAFSETLGKRRPAIMGHTRTGREAAPVGAS